MIVLVWVSWHLSLRIASSWATKIPLITVAHVRIHSTAPTFVLSVIRKIIILLSLNSQQKYNIDFDSRKLINYIHTKYNSWSFSILYTGHLKSWHLKPLVPTA